MTPTFRVIFKGELLPGFDRASTLVAATKRLKASPQQMTQVFAGRVAVLAKGAPRALAQRYIDELATIGLIGRMEEEKRADPALVAPGPAVPVVQLQSKPEPFDPDKTLIVSRSAIAASMPQQGMTDVRERQRPTIESSHPPPQPTVPAFLGTSTRNDEPTIVVPRQKKWERTCMACGETQATAAYCRRCGELLDPGAAPTILVPRSETHPETRSLSAQVTLPPESKDLKPDVAEPEEATIGDFNARSANRSWRIVLAVALILAIAVFAYQLANR